ncbi:hypothetical protein SCA6_012348 [Theobroma cacao]
MGRFRLRERRGWPRSKVEGLKEEQTLPKQGKCLLQFARLDNRPSRRQQKRRIPSIGETDCAEASQRIAFDEEAIAFDEEAIVTLLLKDIWIHDFSQICQTLKKTALTVVMTGDERIVDDWQLPIGLLGSILFLDLFRGDFGFPILAESPSPVTY